MFVATPQDWHKIRGAQMILSMKAISLAWDLDEGRELESKDKKVLLTATPSLLEHLGYTLCPGNSVFGPWVKYSDYMEMLTKPVWVNMVFKCHFSAVKHKSGFVELYVANQDSADPRLRLHVPHHLHLLEPLVHPRRCVDVST